jgi:hypothetical protein
LCFHLFAPFVAFFRIAGFAQWLDIVQGMFSAFGKWLYVIHGERKFFSANKTFVSVRLANAKPFIAAYTSRVSHSMRPVVFNGGCTHPWAFDVRRFSGSNDVKISSNGDTRATEQVTDFIEIVPVECCARINEIPYIFSTPGYIIIGHLFSVSFGLLVRILIRAAKANSTAAVWFTPDMAQIFFRFSSAWSLMRKLIEFFIFVSPFDNCTTKYSKLQYEL